MHKQTLTLAMTFLASVILVVGAHQSAQGEEGKKMKTIRIILDDETITATLDDRAAAREFLALLPLTVDLKDYASTEKIADLPKKLSTAEAPAGFEPKMGDLAYYAPWGNLAIFYKDFEYSRGLIKLGRITSGLKHLDYSGSKRVTIEKFSDEKGEGP